MVDEIADHCKVGGALLEDSGTGGRAGCDTIARMGEGWRWPTFTCCS